MMEDSTRRVSLIVVIGQGSLMFAVSHVPELIILVVIVLLIFGPGRLPGLGRGVGEMIRGFRQETNAAKHDGDEKAEKEEVATKA